VPVKFVIFDLDGTLIESEQIWRDVRRDFVMAHGGRWHEGAQQTMIGMRTGEWAQYIHDELGVDESPDAIARDVADGVIGCIEKNVPVLPGAEGALERLSRDFRLGLATSATARVAEAVLDKTGWRRFFPVAVSADSVAKGKPAPDVYLRALALMDADPAQTAAVEDSANGIRSAANAELAVVAIPNREFPPGPQALSLAARVLPSLEELDANVIRSLRP
jgi:HAD superfamily hydrolase (TIGR01509 family)